MNISTIFLILFVLSIAIGFMGWYMVPGPICGVIGLTYVVLRVLEMLSVVRPVTRRPVAITE